MEKIGGMWARGGGSPAAPKMTLKGKLPFGASVRAQPAPPAIYQKDMRSINLLYSSSSSWAFRGASAGSASKSWPERAPGGVYGPMLIDEEAEEGRRRGGGWSVRGTAGLPHD